MQASTAAYKTTVAGAAMTVDYQVTILLPAGPYSNLTLTAESLTVDRQLTTNMPDGTLLITGYPAASAQITLSGLVDQSDASKTAAWLLNPAESTSPMYRTDALGAPVTIKAGVYTPGNSIPELLTVFTGTVDDYTVNVQAGTVTVSCLDYRGRLVTAPALPSVFDDGVTATTVGPLYAQFALDWILRNAGFYSWPARRASCSLAVGLRGSYWPEVGTLNLSQGYDPTTGILGFPGSQDYVGDGWGMGLVNGQNTYNLNPPIVGATDLFMECIADIGPLGPNVWITDTGPGWVYTHGFAELNVSSASGISVTITNADAATSSTSTFAGGPTSGRHYVGMQVSGTTLLINVDGVTQTFLGISTRANVTYPVAVVTADSAGGSISGVQITTENAAAQFNGSFTPTARFDASLNQMTAFPDVTGQDAWNVIQENVAAESAVGGFDELGVFQFYNRNTISSGASVRTITPTYSLKTLDQELGMSFIRNHIQVPVSAIQVQAAAAVWSLSIGVSVAGGATRQLFISFSNPVVNMDTVASVMPNGGGTPGLSYYRAAQGAGGGGAEISNLAITIQQLSPATAVISIHNPNPFAAWLVTPTAGSYPAPSNGQPNLVVGGRPVTQSGAAQDFTSSASAGAVADAQWPPEVDGGAETNPRGEQLLTIPGNQWMQDLTAAQTLAGDLLIDLYKPRPLWRNVQVVPDLSLQLADLVTVVDPVTTKVDGTALIVGAHMTASGGGWSQTLDLRATGTPGSWILGVAGKSELGVTTYL